MNQNVHLFQAVITGTSFVQTIFWPNVIYISFSDVRIGFSFFSITQILSLCNSLPAYRIVINNFLLADHHEIRTFASGSVPATNPKKIQTTFQRTKLKMFKIVNQNLKFIIFYVWASGTSGSIKKIDRLRLLSFFFPLKSSTFKYIAIKTESMSAANCSACEFHNVKMT